jgi:hypothetical protein
MPKSDLQKRIDELIAQYGGLRPAARAVDIDPSYLQRLQRGYTAGATDKTLKKLGMKRIERYVTVRG